MSNGMGGGGERELEEGGELGERRERGERGGEGMHNYVSIKHFSV